METEKIKETMKSGASNFFGRLIGGIQDEIAFGILTVAGAWALNKFTGKQGGKVDGEKFKQVKKDLEGGDVKAAVEHAQEAIEVSRFGFGRGDEAAFARAWQTARERLIAEEQ